MVIAKSKLPLESDYNSRWPVALSIAAVCLLAGVSAASNIDSYLTNGPGLDLAIAVAAVFAVIGSVYPAPRMLGSVGWVLLAYVGVTLLSLTSTPADVSPETILRSVSTIVLSSAALLVGGALRNRAKDYPKYLIIVQVVCVLLCLAIAAVALLNPAGREKNVLGGVIFATAMLNFLCGYARGERGAGPLVLLAVLVLGGALATGHRLMLALGLAMPLGVALLNLVKVRWARLIPVLLAVSIGVGAIAVYTQYQKIPEFRLVDAEVRKQTGRSMLSGRQKMWGSISEAIIEAPPLGYGPTVRASDVTGRPFSTHNAFLNVGLQGGFVGLIVVFGLVAAIGYRAFTAPVDSAGVILSVYLGGVLVHNSFETVLFTNSFPIAVLTWTNLGFLVASCMLPPAPPKPKRVPEYAAPPVKVHVRGRGGA
ncbi:O-antigen ligase family protein [Caulobacter sp.]|uniref:O-antigen ligase family protein n=1 Tax=Caulobacter sp. TaxID=78 RepID=UPI003BA8DB00